MTLKYTIVPDAMHGSVGACRGSEDSGLLEPQMLASSLCARPWDHLLVQRDW